MLTPPLRLRKAYLQLVNHHFRLFQLVETVPVPALVRAHGLPLGPQHLEIQLDEFQVRRRRGVSFSAQLPLKPSRAEREGGSVKRSCVADTVCPNL